MGELVNMSDQFEGLPLDALIAGPLDAAGKCSMNLANITASFIQTVGFEQNDDGTVGAPRTAEFKFRRPYTNADGDILIEDVGVSLPLLACVNPPNLGIETVRITFDMEVKSSFAAHESEDKSLTVGVDVKAKWGPVKASVDIRGSVSTHKENTRTSDNSAKYSIEVLAKRQDPPEALMRVFDLMASAAAPHSITKEDSGDTGNGSDSDNGSDGGTDG